MPSINSSLIVYLIIGLVPILAKERCFLDDKILENFPEIPREVYCDTTYQECCDKGCCETGNRSGLMLQIGFGKGMSPFVWFLAALIVSGYIYFCVRFCVKKFHRRDQRRRHTSVTISRGNTEPQELSLMLSFNQNRSGLERFNFENVGTGHIHVPFIPTTPVTPPPAYVTLTPPPTYNVAIHFSPMRDKQSQAQIEQNSEIKS